MRVNLNHRVRVKLTDIGRAALKANHDKLFSVYGSRAPQFELPEEDSDGWSEWQLWSLMRELGPHISLGMNTPVETEIDIIEGQ